MFSISAAENLVRRNKLCLPAVESQVKNQMPSQRMMTGTGQKLRIFLRIILKRGKKKFHSTICHKTVQLTYKFLNLNKNVRSESHLQSLHYRKESLVSYLSENENIDCGNVKPRKAKKIEGPR